jgi:CRP-like cAMP-binding protein
VTPFHISLFYSIIKNKKKRSNHGYSFEERCDILINYISALETVDLFKCFSTDELDKLFQNNLYRISSYSKDSMVHLQNEKCESLDIILSGTVSIQKIYSNGDLLTICNFSDGEVMGENLLFSHRNFYPMTITAKCDTKILHIKRELILKLCQDNIKFLMDFLQSASDKTLILMGKIKTLALKTIRQCIVEYLLYEYHIQKSTTIKLNMTKKELAEKIGVQRPSLSRELNKMRKDGLITYDPKQITILNVDSLNKLHIDS